MIRPAVSILAVVCLATGCSLVTNFKEECVINPDCAEGFFCDEGFCAAGSGLPRVSVDSNIDSDTTWTNDRVWVLNSLVTILPSVTLTIEKGTTILGNRGSALVAREGGVIEARGTARDPIVFTSAKPVGQRQTGDWGGIALMGKAPVNRENATLRLITDEAEARFGGPDKSWNCGTLRYVRIEFGGGQVEGEEALNGLTLAGCGTGTTVDHVHVHYGADDGVEIFGGTVNLAYIVVTRAQDDSFDIDLGWQGLGQYIAIQQDSAADNAIEIDNLQEEPERPPLTSFGISNYTVIGPGEMGLTKGITVKAGGAGFFSHGIIMGSTVDAVDVVGEEAGARAIGGEVTVQKTMFFDVGPSGEDYFPIAGAEGEIGPNGEPDDDGGFDEDEFFRAAEWENKFGIDPQIESPFDLQEPSWTPFGEPVTDVGPPPAGSEFNRNGRGFNADGEYHGAFEPGEEPWTAGWTEFPGG